MTEEFALHEAARDKKPLAVRALLKGNPKLVFKKDLDGRVALHWSVSSNDPEITSMLLHPWLISGTNPFEIDVDDLTDDSGWTPLHISSAIGNLEVLSLLLNNNPSPSLNLQANTGQTVIHLSTSKNLYETTKFLIEKGASARIKDNKGQTALFRASSNGYIRLIRLLCELGKSQVNIKDKFGWTPMHHALAEGHGDAAVELVKLGADPDIEDAEGLKPMDVAVDDKVKAYFIQNV